MRLAISIETSFPRPVASVDDSLLPTGTVEFMGAPPSLKRLRTSSFSQEGAWVTWSKGNADDAMVKAKIMPKRYILDYLGAED